MGRLLAAALVLAAGLSLGPRVMGGNLVPSGARYDEGDGLELRHRTIHNLNPGAIYSWTRITSATLELPNGRVLPASCRFTSPATSVRLTGLAGTDIEDELISPPPQFSSNDQTPPSRSPGDTVGQPLPGRHDDHASAQHARSPGPGQ